MMAEEQEEKEDVGSAVMLVVSHGDRGSRDRSLWRVADGRGMGIEEWQSLLEEAETVDGVCVWVDRDRLREQSRYFSSLENFSESKRESIHVDWSVPTFCLLLQWIHGFQSLSCFSSSVVAPLLQGAVYFGVDEVISKCKDWVDCEMCTIRWGAGDGFLDDLLSIWSTAAEHGENSIRELCERSLAINFAQAMVRESFVTLPLPLVDASIDHPELTIKSEMELCDALLLWYEHQERVSPEDAAAEDPIYLLKKIQLDLLPIEFIIRRLLGKYPLNTFYTSSATSGESDSVLLNSLIDMCGDLASKPVKVYLGFKPVIRLTGYLKELDLLCCYQITCDHLIAAAAQVATLPNSTTRKALVAREHEAWPGFPEFINMEKLNLSHCWRIEPESLLLWLKLVCPNLRELRVQHCGYPLQMILEIGSSLPHLVVLDLSEPEALVDIMGAVTRTKTICSNYRLQPTRHFVYASVTRREYVSNRLRELSLQGRSELTDDFLLRVARNCPLLQAVDLSGCSELSDAGVAAFLNVYNHLGLRSLSAAGTRFGPISCISLVVQADSSKFEDRHVLETLDLGRCSGLGSNDLSSLLQALPFLVSLGLAFTELDDMALSAFLGTSLRHLNLRETKVSGGVLSQILARNLSMRDLNIRGCTQLAVHPFDFSLVQQAFEWENVEAGWGLSDSTFSSNFGLSSWTLQNLAIGVGGSISGHTLLCVSEKCPELKRLSLSFQVMFDEDLVRAVRKLKSLHTLELQNTSLNSGNLLAEIASNLPNLKKVKLERVMPLLSDNDLLLFSQSCTRLQSLSLLGCQRLTSDSLSTMANAWRGLQDLRLEDCPKILTRSTVYHILTSFQILEVLHLRHIGKVLPDNFIAEATRNLPFLQKLAIDVCDAIDDKYSSSERKETSRLKSVYINRCKSIKDSKFHLNAAAFKTESTCSHYEGRTHKDTIVLEWNSVRLKESIVTKRLTFQ